MIGSNLGCGPEKNHSVKELTAEEAIKMTNENLLITVYDRIAYNASNGKCVLTFRTSTRSQIETIKRQLEKNGYKTYITKQFPDWIDISWCD